MKHVSKMKHQRGVTLIELMVVMVIVAILAAIAYPSYQRQVAKTHRKTAAACLSQIAQAMERRYTTNLTYANPAGNTEDQLACTTADGLDRFYEFSFVDDPTQSEYEIQAEPTDLQSSRDINCGILTLDNQGQRGSENNANCW